MNYARSKDFGPALLPRSFFTFHQLMQAKLELVSSHSQAARNETLEGGVCIEIWSIKSWTAVIGA